jgi:hypothetical protein
MSKTLQWIIGISIILIAAAVVFSAVWPFVAPNTAWANYGMPGGMGMMGGQSMMGGRGMMGRGMMGGNGLMNMMGGSLPAPMHDAMLDTLAEKLGLTRAELDSRIANGETPAQIAAANGLSGADFSTLLADAHKAALDQAVADGYLTQAQADSMLDMMGGHGNCPFFGATTAP